MCRLRKWQEAQWAEQLFWSRFTEDYIHQTKELEARWIIGKDFRLRGEDLQEFIMVEIGCGPLGFLPFIKGRLKVGLDPIVHNLWKKVADVDYMRAIGEFLPIRSESVDVVICYNVIDHCMDPCRVLKEINRILRPRGLLLFEVNVYGRIFTYIKIFSEKLRGKLVTFDVRHPHTFHKKSVYSLLRVAGFDIII
jgi:SAM-dependent methyltransferase